MALIALDELELSGVPCHEGDAESRYAYPGKHGWRGSLGRLLYGAFFRAAEASGCGPVRAVTFPVNRASVAFHQRMGFQLEPGDTEAGGMPVSCGYDGPGSDRVRLLRILGGRYSGQVLA